MTRHIVLVCLLGTLLSTASAQEKQHTTIDLLAKIDPEKHAVFGTWTRTADGLVAGDVDANAMIEAPYEVGSLYALTLTFTRTAGDDTIGVVLPLGDRQCLLELSAWQGTAHGVSRVEGRSVKDERNPTRVAPGTLENGRKQTLLVKVASQKSSISVTASLNGKQLFLHSAGRNDWQANIALQKKNNTLPGIAVAKSAVVVHSFSVSHPKRDANAGPEPKSTADGLRIIDGQVLMAKTKYAPTTGSVEVVSVMWGEHVHIEGTEAVAIVSGLTLNDGTIEAEIRSGTFSGLAFRGKDEKNYDLIYLRPQNSGTEKHDKTVQYVSKGVPGADWATLRRRFPGKYEAGADVKVDEWFKLRIVLKGETASAYVGDAKEPSLVVSQLLGGRDSGAIGLWGWDTDIRKLQVVPAE